MGRPLAHFRRAIARDSSYALAWTGLADARSLLAGYGFGSPDTLPPGTLDARRAPGQVIPSDPRPGPNVYDGARAALLPSSPD